MEMDLDNPKHSQISKLTLFLNKEEGGTNLIDFKNKMKAFRILLVCKYINCQDKTWTGILRYWYAVNIYSITRQRWNNSYPHCQDTENIPQFFKRCLNDFKDFSNKHGLNLNETISSRQIYKKLINERNYRPAAITRYSEMGLFLEKLPMYKFLDPYLREFLYKLYHCKLYFKRYRLNINDMLNFGQKCILCNDAIDTPDHLFENCEKGFLLRNKRNLLITFYNNNNITLSAYEKVYSFLNRENQNNKIFHYIITASNYSIYKIKMKKFYDSNYIVTEEAAMHAFSNRLKLRIICDHRRLSFEKFKEQWDPNNSHPPFQYNRNKITLWNF